MTKQSLRCVLAAWMGFALVQVLSASTALGQVSILNIDPERLALARKKLEACGQRRLVEDSLPLSLELQTRVLMMGSPESEQALLRKSTQLSEIARKRAPLLLEAFARVYALELSSEELTDYIRFCESPEGRRIVAKLPAVARGIALEKLIVAGSIKSAISKQYADELKNKTPALPTKVDATPLGVPPKTEPRASRPPRNTPPPRQDGPTVPESKP